MTQHPRRVSLLAPAKVNLYLHLTGKRTDGYHFLDSLTAFASIGDAIRIEEAERFSFDVDGPFAPSLSENERENSADSSNIAVRAAIRLAEAARREPRLSLHLTKNLPPAAGIGGGSADAAAVVRGLISLWGLPSDAPYLVDLLRMLGADVPVCFHGRPARLRGIGEILDPVPALPVTPLVLINPRKACPTPEIFRQTRAAFKAPLIFPEKFETVVSLAAFLNSTENALTDAALKIVPEIADCLSVLSDAEGCLLARMSGSGATCFGLFTSEPDALRCVQAIRADHPDWWVHAGVIQDA